MELACLPYANPSPSFSKHKADSFTCDRHITSPKKLKETYVATQKHKNVIVILLKTQHNAMKNISILVKCVESYVKSRK